MEWKAEVTVSGIPSVTEEELEQMLKVIPGVIRHDANAGELHMVWRFPPEGGLYITGAMERVSDKWRRAVRVIEGAAPLCTDYRVRLVSEEQS